MMMVWELVLVLGLLVSAHCELRSRDPGEEEEDSGEHGVRPNVGDGYPDAFVTPAPGEAVSFPARTGNWCSFVHKRVVTTAVKCGTEMYNIKSQSPCPSGSPGCHLILYKMSNRPLYKQEQKVITSLLWHCCPGHGGDNCDDADSSSATYPPPPSGVYAQAAALRGDPDREQNDYQHYPGASQEAANQHQQNLTRSHAGHAHNQDHAASQPGHAHNQDHAASQPGHAHNQDHAASQPGHAQNPYQTAPYPSHPNVPYQTAAYPGLAHNQDHANLPPGHAHDPYRTAPLPGHGHTQDHGPHHAGTPGQHPNAEERRPPTVLDEDQTAVLPVPHMMALVMSQLQPVLEGFNRSLEHLSRQVGALAGDVARLKSSQLEAELRAELQERPQDAEAERLEARVEDVAEQVREVQRQLEVQRYAMENRLHSQHAMLHYNLTSFKTDIDMKLKRHQKMLQISLQAMNASLAELKLEQDLGSDQNPDVGQDLPAVELLPPPPLSLPSSEASELWEAIKRLDNMVVNNTVKVDGLMEDADVTSGRVLRLGAQMKVLDKRINQTGRDSQVKFMMTGLEVEAAKVAVLTRVGELAGNLSLQGQRLSELDVDVDYLYTAIYRHNASECDCQALRAAVARLERGVANVTELANENRMALEEEGGGGHWDGAANWEPAVEALQLSLQQVKESLAHEQSRTGSVESDVARLSGSVSGVVSEVSGLKEVNRRLVEDRNHLLGSFNSLLQDGIRHSDVLELLLGEEVLEFLDWPEQDQETYSVPALKEQLRQLREQLAGLNLSFSSALGHPPGREEVPSNDQPPSSSSQRGGDGDGPARERQLLLSDGGDLWRLEKTVDELKLQLLQAEERGGQQAALQAEVTWLKRGLEEHLRVFKNVFSNADVLASSEATLELDKLWQLLRSKDGKKEKKRGGGGGGGGGGGRGGNHRNKRAFPGLPVASSYQTMFSGSPRSVSDGLVLFDARLNRRGFYSDAGTFTAPVGGVYQFTLTLSLQPGAAHIDLQGVAGREATPLLRTAGAGAEPLTRTARLRLAKGEGLRLELRRGSWAESGQNALEVARLLRHT